MVRRRSDTTPDPPGGRAAERLRMFEEARHPCETPQAEHQKQATNKAGKPPRPPKKGRKPSAKQDRRKT